MSAGTVVVDASVLVEMVLHEADGAPARARVTADGCRMVAPHLVDLEVASAVRRKVLARRLALHDAVRSMEVYRDIPLRRFPHVLLLDRIFALHATVTPYDAAYIALAEILDAPLVTFDATLAGAPGIVARVEVLTRPGTAAESDPGG